jgi:hypothetical protein
MDDGGVRDSDADATTADGNATMNSGLQWDVSAKSKAKEKFSPAGDWNQRKVGRQLITPGLETLVIIVANGPDNICWDLIHFSMLVSLEILYGCNMRSTEQVWEPPRILITKNNDRNAILDSDVLSVQG